MCMKMHDPKRAVSQKGDPLYLMPSPVLSSLDAHFLKALKDWGLRFKIVKQMWTPVNVCLCSVVSRSESLCRK